MSVFTREAPCDGCQAVLPKKSLQHFDPSWRGERFTQDARRRLCAPCLSGALGESLRAFEYRALAIAPTPKGLGYAFAPLEIGTNAFLWTEELKDTVRGLLPSEDALCRRCGARARFNWCGLDIFEGSPYELRLKPRGRFGEELLCGDCAAAEFDRIFRGSAAFFSEVMPPADDSGVLSPAG